jgi:hypothetical protein
MPYLNKPSRAVDRTITFSHIRQFSKHFMTFLLTGTAAARPKPAHSRYTVVV